MKRNTSRKRIAGFVGSLVLGACAAPEANATLAELRPDDTTSTELFRFAVGDTIESFSSPGSPVRVFYTRAGVNAVPSADADASGVPDSVEMVARTYEDALAFYSAEGFRAPVSDLGTPGGDGGDDRFDVYLVDFGGRADGAYRRERCTGSVCSGFMVQENDFSGYAYPSFAIGTRVVASHELFHAVQAAYDADISANFSEGTAVWATEAFDPSLNDFEAFTGGYLATPERSLDQAPIGPVDGFTYGLCLFARYLSERHDDAIVREIWEGLEDGAGGVADPLWLPTVARVLETRGVPRFEDAYFEFGTWVLYTGLGGPAGETFAQAARYPRVTRVTETLPHEVTPLRVFTSSMRVWTYAPSGRSAVTASLIGSMPGDLDTLGLAIAVRRGASIDVTRVALDGSASVDTAGADEVVVAVMNGAVDGSSARPGLCVGTVAEVTACRTRLAGSDAGMIEVDAGVISGSDASTDASTDAGTATLPSASCSCRVGHGSATGSLAASALLALALLGRRRR